MPQLTIKQEKACQKYIEIGDKSAAYRFAYNCSKMKPESINRKAHEFFDKVKIRSRVEELQKEVAKRNDLTIDEIIRELKTMIFFNPKELFNENGTLKKIPELDSDAAKAISSIDVLEVFQGGNLKRSTKLRFHNKLDAIEKMAKHLGFYEKDAPTNSPNKTVIILPDNGRD